MGMPNGGNAGAAAKHSGIEGLMAGAAFAEDQSLCLTQLQVELQKAAAINIDNPVPHLIEDIVETQEIFKESLAEARVLDSRNQPETLNNNEETQDCETYLRSAMKTSEKLQTEIDEEESKVAELSQCLAHTEAAADQARKCMEEDLHALQEVLAAAVESVGIDAS